MQQYREAHKEVSYADAFRQAARCAEAGEMRGRVGKVPPPVTSVTEESVVVSRFNFLAFMVEVMCEVKQAKNH